MGIPGMFNTLEERGVFKTTEYCHQAKGECGPCVVFHDDILPRLIMYEMRRQPTDTGASWPVAYKPRNGGWVTQFRAFASCYLKQLVEEYDCKIVWARDGGVNDKPSTLDGVLSENIDPGCVDADDAIKSTGGAANRGTLDMVSEMRWPMNGLCSTDDAVLDAFAACGDGLGGNDVRVVNAAANCTNGEVWRQAIKFLHGCDEKERSTFVVSGDAEILFFRESSPDVGVVLMSPYAMEHDSGDTAPMIGAQWACDLNRDVEFSTKLLRFTYCTVTDDVAHALGVEPELLPVLAACLGGDLCTYDPSVYNATVGIKSALVDKHFEDGSAAAQAFKSLPDVEPHAPLKGAKARWKGAQPCNHGKYCRTLGCAFAHPKDGNLWCSGESIRGQRCCRPTCFFRHVEPMAFEIAPYALDKYGVASKFTLRAVFSTWREAVETLASMQEARKQSCLGVGLKLPIGHGLRGAKDIRNIIYEKTIELVNTLQEGQWKSDSGEIDVEVCVRDLCQWLCTVSGRDEHDVSEALTRAIGVYNIPPLDEDALPAVLHAPTTQLEARRVRECYLPGPYPLPSDSGYLNYVTEHLRSRLGSELGMKATVEGAQVGNTYTVRMLPSEEPLPGNDPPTTASDRLNAALGFGGDNDGRWPQDLDDILQGIPLSCSIPPLKILLLNLPYGQKRLSQPLLGGESVGASVGAFKTAMLALALWQRTLRLDDVTVRVPHKYELRREDVEPLERWEIRAFISSCLLSWIQQRMMSCPFDLLAGNGDTAESREKAAMFSSVPEKLRRRIFVLAAQFFELANDVKQITHMLDGGDGPLSRGFDEIVFNPEAIFAFYTAVGGWHATEGMDRRVRAKFGAVLNSLTTTTTTTTTGLPANEDSTADVCDRLVDHLTGSSMGSLATTSGADDYLEY